MHKSHSYINTPSQMAVLTKCFRRGRPELLPYVIFSITIFKKKSSKIRKRYYFPRFRDKLCKIKCTFKSGCHSARRRSHGRRIYALSWCEDPSILGRWPFTQDDKYGGSYQSSIAAISLPSTGSKAAPYQ